MAVHLLGIRHHGPGSARNVASFLKQLQPDIILVEGPPEAEPLLRWVVHKEMKPPVALLAYQPDNPKQAVFYPFATFSAEWQALYYGIYNNIPVRFFDMPLSHSFALSGAGDMENEEEQTGDKDFLSSRDPFGYFAQIEGYHDGEIWWEKHFESRRNDTEIFEAIKEAVIALRESLPAKNDQREKLREAFMRKGIHTAEKEKYNRIAVVCGAWHVPALAHMPPQKEDSELMKGLPKVKVETTWIPWTFNRLTFRSGYGAGVHSPGWYDHLWHFPEDDGTRWMSKVARLFREHHMDTSVAHVIEAVRLANALAAIRNYSRPGLEEFNEATISVLGFGNDILLQLIHEELIVSDQMGSVPDTVPKVPLLIDVEQYQRKFRLSPSAGVKELKLDLREPNELAKSTFLHRVQLLGVGWGKLVSSHSKGTFKEIWQLLWEPEHSLQIIEKGIWGNTLEIAAIHYLSHLAFEAKSASQVVDLLEKSIPADLPLSVESIVRKLDILTAATSDITELMKSVPGLANVVRYGNVRNTDFSVLKNMLDSVVSRICIGIHLTCTNIDIDEAQVVLELIIKTDYAVFLVNDGEMAQQWQEALLRIQNSRTCNPLIAGYTTRLLTDRKVTGYPETEKQLSYYMSVTNAPSDAAFWFEGFLKSSGTVLLLDDQLWNLMNNWIASTPEDMFMELLPILRRTFSGFTQVERRKLGEKAKGASEGVQTTVTTPDSFHYERAGEVLPVVKLLLGIKDKLEEAEND